MFIIKGQDKYSKIEQIFNNFNDANTKAKELVKLGYTVSIETL